MQGDYAGVAIIGERHGFSLHGFSSEHGYTALVAYEYLITFHEEVATVWKRKLTATSLLLLSTRYVLILTQILTFVPASPAVGTLFRSSI